ncbi:MAG: cytochrome ubiquinol oxidase subunit I [Candidatus Rickettsia vulgarisii]
MEFDSNLLARIQFAFTISFHIIFPSLTIGLASWLAVIEGLWLKTNNNIYQEIYRFWIKIFAVTFGMGVVSGVVMSYQFGTNWSGFSDKLGNVLGPLLGYEVLTAFFLESSFLGIMLFGWNRVSKKMHFAATLIVAIGTIISAFWILAANSWMQTPTGYTVGADNIVYPVSWLEIIFNPSFPYRFFHMIIASYLTTAFIVGGVAAWYLLQKKFVEHAKIMFVMAMLMAVLVTPVQIFIGDLHGLNTMKYQPVKVSAMEGIWETEKGAALRLIGWPDDKEETTKYSIEIPKLASLILTHQLDGEIKGLKEWSKENRPPVLMVFLAFRIMVGIGLLMLLTGVIAVILTLRRKLFETKWFQYFCILMSPAGFIAVIAGWFVTEIGRQPYVAYNLIRTSEASSPVLGQYIFISLIAFVIVYSFIFGAGSYYILKLIRKGPTIIDNKETYGVHSIENTLISSKELKI